MCACVNSASGLHPLRRRPSCQLAERCVGYLPYAFRRRVATQTRMLPVILTGWKEISNHLRFGVRTVQRWEHHGLPVTRVNKSPRSPVVADSEALDAWVLHRSRNPPGAPERLVENLRRARELQREVTENRKELQLRLQTLRKEMAEFRAKRAKSRKRDSGGVR